MLRLGQGKHAYNIIIICLDFHVNVDVEQKLELFRKKKTRIYIKKTEKENLRPGNVLTTGAPCEIIHGKSSH